eukprot:709337-Hanusia_phi.AAC.1
MERMMIGEAVCLHMSQRLAEEPRADCRMRVTGCVKPMAVGASSNVVSGDGKSVSIGAHRAVVHGREESWTRSLRAAG